MEFTAPSDDEAPEPQFSRPVRQIVQMLIVLALVGAGVYAIYPNVAPVFLANVWLNGLIAAVFVIGVVSCFAQVYQLTTSVRWIEDFAIGGARSGAVPRLLVPLAALLRTRGANRKISSASAGSILESVATRIEEARDITRYLVSLLIFLGLLGTFYGLATVVPGVVETIRSLAPQDGEGGVEIFNRLMSGLEIQLEGMGTAFSSSLLGLAGSLVVGLLELFASRGQNRFYRELEEWLSSITRLGFAHGDTELSGETGAMVAVLDQMAEQMDQMREALMRSVAAGRTTDDKLSEVATAVTALTRQMEHGDRTSEALARLAETQEALVARLERGGHGDYGGAGDDGEARMRLRSIDVQLLRLLEELSAGRQETVADIRADIAQLTKELRRLRGPGPAGGGPAGVDVAERRAAGPGE
ncbi:MAG: biopolymer transporter ExbB [Paracoccaceae bacterium]|jgi:hypothetical protein|nr:biopolymer transporter ExbB [Paracoccaceae bacterium]